MCEPLGQGIPKMDLFAGDRMGEADGPGMQIEAFAFQEEMVGTVGGVAQDGIAHPGQVSAQLMPPPGARLEKDEVQCAKPR